MEKVNAALEKARETIEAAKQPAGEPTGEALQKVLQRAMPFEYSLDYAYGCASPWTWRGAGAVSHIYADASSCVRAAWSNKIAAARDEEAAKHAAASAAKVWSGFTTESGDKIECLAVCVHRQTLSPFVHASALLPEDSSDWQRLALAQSRKERISATEGGKRGTVAYLIDYLQRGSNGVLALRLFPVL